MCGLHFKRKLGVSFDILKCSAVTRILNKINEMLAFALVVILAVKSSSCPNSCSGRGVCTNGSMQLCSCFPGCHGVDCSIRLCPSGTAWVDFPTAANTAHADYTECSNMVQYIEAKIFNCLNFPTGKVRSINRVMHLSIRVYGPRLRYE